MRDYEFNDPYAQENYEAALNGDSKAAFNLAECFEEGMFGVKNDYRDAEHWYLVAAELGYKPAYRRLASLYHLEFKDSISDAIFWYEKASEEGDWFAQYNVGSLLLKEEYRDVDRAIYWLEQAAAQKSTRAYQILANLYEEGTLVQQDLEKTLYYSVKALGPDNLYPLEKYEKPEALLKVGIMYYLGWGTEPDYALAVKYFTEASNLDLPEAKSWIARSYYDGLGTEQSDKKAFFWYSKAARLDCTEGILGLGICYLYGIGCKENREKAIANIEIAANRGNPDAIEILNSL